MAGSSIDPLVNYTFCLEIQGVTEASFREASGFGSSTEVVESREQGPGGRQIIKKLPGNLKWDDIVLKRGESSNLALYQWRKKVVDGDIVGARVSGSIVCYDPKLTEVARYNFVNGWPSKWKGGDLNSTANQVVIEEVTITHEGMERVK